MIPDLDEAIMLSRDALELWPPGHSGRAVALYNLADNLRDRFVKLSEIANLDEAITSITSHFAFGTDMENRLQCLT